MNGVRLERAQRARRVRQVRRVDAGDDQRAELAGSRRPRAAPRWCGQASRAAWPCSRPAPPRRAPSGRRPSGRSAAGRACAPASTAPRSPARRGIQASFAPVASASRAAAASAPGTSASRSPTRITAPGWASRSAARLKSASLPPPAASAVSAAGSAPGTVGSSVPDTLARPGEASAATENTASALLAGRLAQPQEHDRRLVFRLEPGEQHRRRGLQVGVADLDVAPGHPGGEELLLLRRVRPCPHVDVVGVQRDPGELGVRVGVLKRQPAAGEHADAAAVVPARVARGREAARPPPRTRRARRPGAARRRRRGPAAWSAGRTGWRS